MFTSIRPSSEEGGRGKLTQAHSMEGPALPKGVAACRGPVSNRSSPGPLHTVGLG